MYVYSRGMLYMKGCQGTAAKTVYVINAGTQMR